MLAGKDQWNESRDNLHDQQTPVVPLDNLVADNEVITKPRHGGELSLCIFAECFVGHAVCSVLISHAFFSRDRFQYRS